MLKLKLLYFDHLMWRVTHWKRPWCWERLEAKGEGAAEEEIVRCITNTIDKNLNKLCKTVEDKGAWHPAVFVVSKSQTWLRHWNTIAKEKYGIYKLYEKKWSHYIWKYLFQMLYPLMLTFSRKSLKLFMRELE